jgi:hypothetical protein
MRSYDPTDIFCARLRHRCELILADHRLGKVVIASKSTLPNPDMMVAVFTLMIMGLHWSQSCAYLAAGPDVNEGLR